MAREPHTRVCYRHGPAVVSRGGLQEDITVLNVQIFLNHSSDDVVDFTIQVSSSEERDLVLKRLQDCLKPQVSLTWVVLGHA